LKLLVLILALFAFEASADTGLIFPSNDATAGDVYAFQFTDPGSNGLPQWGTADGGITLMWEYRPEQQTGYYVTFFYSKPDGCFQGVYVGPSPGDCSGSAVQQFWGAHPYPQKRSSSGTTHIWEISAGTHITHDRTDTVGGGEFDVVYDTWHHQALLVEKSGSTISYTFYPDLPSVDDDNRLELSGNNGLTESSAPDLYFGDAPWNQQYSHKHERMSGTFRNLRIIDATMTEQEILDNVDSDTLVGSNAINNVWYRRADMSPDAAGDGIEDESGNANNPEWVDQNFLPGLYAVPEPSTSLLMGFALATIGALRRAWRPVSGRRAAS
jgi:hypothetical protein